VRPLPLLFLLPFSASAALKVYPDRVTLTGPQSRQALVVQHIAGDGRTTDVTASVKVQSPAPVQWDAVTGLLAPTGDGSGEALIQWENEQATLTVTTNGFAGARTPSFRLDVEPVLMRAGCNTGSCHGSGRGQDGFRLSLFGYDPAGDFFRLTRELIGRRVDLEVPAQSLVLEKSIGAVPHTGGTLFKPDSDYYRVLHDWIAAGARDDAPGTPLATGIRIFPDKIEVRASVTSPAHHRTLVMAEYSDGSLRDVTRLALFLSNNDSTATIGKDGTVIAGASGGAHVFARFDKFTAGTEVIVLPDRNDFTWPDLKAANPVDEAVFARLRQLQIAPSAPAEDAGFLRRVTLDLTGLPPSPEVLSNFLADAAPDKRNQAIDRLLATEAFTDLWTMKWAEILQVKVNNQNADTGRSRQPVWKYYQWLRAQIAANRPFNELVRDLIRAEGSNTANPPANYYTSANGNIRTPMERAEDTAQLFLGTRIQCAQCHNHPFDRWTMDDYYGFTAFFKGVSQKKGASATEVFIFNRPGQTTVEHPVDGRAVSPRFLGGDQPELKGGDPRHFLADWLTAPGNETFARTLANRAWFHFFGRGVIEPVDDGRISNPPSNEKLLATLADHLRSANFDIRSLIRTICQSQTYQLSSTANESNASDDRNFSRSYVRRLQAEVILDTLAAVTGTPNSFSGQMPGTRATQIFDGGADRDYFLKTFGSSKRETVCTAEVRMEPTLTQALHLINGNVVDGAIQRSPVLTGLMKQKPTAEAGVVALYERALSRRPTAYELARFMESARSLPEGDQAALRQFFDDTLWALINTTEFAFNH
jgi:hypothetical protein